METYIIRLQSIVEFEFQVDASTPTEAFDKFKDNQARETGDRNGDLVRDYSVSVEPVNMAARQAEENYYYDLIARTGNGNGNL